MPSHPQARIAPSILSSDFAQLADECRRMVDAGADWLHVDCMDGHFVPNLTIGAPVVKSLRKHTKAYLDCHLMVSRPEQWVEDFKKAGADGYTFHLEATEKARELCESIQRAGMRAGIALKPGTPVDDALHELIVDGLVDLVLVMTVEPGFGGQSFMASCVPKVALLRERYPQLHIQVDGGIARENIEQVARAGANVIVAGTSIFGADNPAEAIRFFRETVNRHS